MFEAAPKRLKLPPTHFSKSLNSKLKHQTYRHRTDLRPLHSLVLLSTCTNYMKMTVNGKVEVTAHEQVTVFLFFFVTLMTKRGGGRDL